MPKQIPEADRFWEKVRFSPEANGCWIWTASRKKGTGYGYFRAANGKLVQAHRCAYQRAYGPLEAGLHIHHRCHNQACVRPDHMQPLTEEAHIAMHPTKWRRAIEISAHRRRAQTHCKRGHDLANSWVEPAGRRHCRVCSAIRQRVYKANRKA